MKIKFKFTQLESKTISILCQDAAKDCLILADFVLSEIFEQYYNKAILKEYPEKIALTPAQSIVLTWRLQEFSTDVDVLTVLAKVSQTLINHPAFLLNHKILGL